MRVFDSTNFQETIVSMPLVGAMIGAALGVGSALSFCRSKVFVSSLCCLFSEIIVMFAIK